MNTPPLFIGAALAFWGWQSGHFVVGALLGVALETLRALQLRIDLGVKEHSTIADLSTVGFVLLAVLLAANIGIGRGILEAFTWQPVALAPIIAAQLVTADRRLPLSALFRYMRKLTRANPEINDPRVDTSSVYAALTLLAAGVANQRGPEYYVAVVAGTACLLYAARPRGIRATSLAAGALMLCAAAALGHVGHIGLSQLQLALVDWVLDLDMRVVDADPYRTRTEMGSLGRLKKYDAIVLRVYADAQDARRVQLLHRASYNTYVGGIWVARGAPMEAVQSEADNETWVLDKAGARDEPQGLPPKLPLLHIRMSSRFEGGRSLLPLPAGTTRLASFPARELRRNELGAVHAQLEIDWVNYEAQAAPAIALYAAPMPEDSAIPADEKAVLERTVAELGLLALAPAERLRRIDKHLGSFAYSTFRERPVPEGETALGDFLTRTHAGHCEYFAAAATLLARAAGVPARYATGFAAIEYSRLESAWVVRTRHAHAWTRAWVDGRWIELDATPPAWGAEEADQAPFWQGLADLFRYTGFRWSQRGEFSAGDGWYAVLVALALYLAWRVLRGRRVLREEKAAAAERRRYPGEDSEFYVVEKSLPPRASSETHTAWLKRITADFSLPKLHQVREALRLHQRYRFDPQGISTAERNRLRELCQGLSPRMQ
jgi:transglutaminase-like putative cysteine protease